MNPIIIKRSFIQNILLAESSSLVQTFLNFMFQKFGDELSSEAMNQLNSDQITLWGFHILYSEVMNGGFIQLAYNGYGSFIFDSPFAKAMRLWGLKDLSKLLYKAKIIYDKYKSILCLEKTDQEFMAFYEQFPYFEELDDQFIEESDLYVKSIAIYISKHIELFAEITNE